MLPNEKEFRERQRSPFIGRGLSEVFDEALKVQAAPKDLTRYVIMNRKPSLVTTEWKSLAAKCSVLFTSELLSLSVCFLELGHFQDPALHRQYPDF